MEEGNLPGGWKPNKDKRNDKNSREHNEPTT